jgi:1-acyl-sn-glycerol-3-phosphate acyltransferase
MGAFMLYLLRMLLMSVHFIVAGMIGILVGLCRPFNPDNSRLCGRLYSLPAMRILGFKVKPAIKGLLEHQRSCVIVANHQSNYDLFVFGGAVPARTVTIGKKSLKWIPFFGQLFWLSGNVLIDRGNAQRAKKAMLATTDTLQHKDTSIWVFVEGTRNKGRGLLPFKKGAFQMAINAGVPILPVCVSTYSKHMQLNNWHATDVLIRSLEPIPTAGLTQEDLPALIEQCRNQMLACIEELDQQLMVRA